MPFSAFGFVLARAVAQGQGAPEAEATRLGVVGGVLRPPVLGVLASSVLARRQTPVVNPPPPSVQRQLGQGQGQPSLKSGEVVIPDVRGLDLEKAREVLGAFELEARSWEKKGEVTGQYPPGGAIRTKKSAVMLEVGSKVPAQEILQK